jgi:hypothetical protein
MSAWSDLPNAKHIDRVIATLKKHTEIWGEARDATWDAVRTAARHPAWKVIYDSTWMAKAWNEARDAVRDAVRDEPARRAGPALNSAWGAILALIAYDDCEQYLSMTSEELQVWARLSENSAAVLLLPAVVAFERIAELETV